LKVYSGLSRFSVYITGQGTNIKEEEVWRFTEIVELSEFYFSESISDRMNSISKRSFELLSLNNDWNTARSISHPTAIPLVQPRHKLMQEIRDDCYKIAEDMKGVLRVGNA
jgi:hypothetical protein